MMILGVNKLIYQCRTVIHWWIIHFPRHMAINWGWYGFVKFRGSKKIKEQCPYSILLPQVVEFQNKESPQHHPYRSLSCRRWHQCMVQAAMASASHWGFSTWFETSSDGKTWVTACSFWIILASKRMEFSQFFVKINTRIYIYIYNIHILQPIFGHVGPVLETTMKHCQDAKMFCSYVA